MSSTPSLQYITIPNNPTYPFVSGGTYYLYLWAGNTTYGSNVNIQPTGELVIDLYYSGNFVRLYAGGAWSNYQAYVCNGTGWDGYKPMIHNGSAWVEHG